MEPNPNHFSYQRILKSTSIFGMVKLSTVLISLVKSKFLAILIGPKGYGILGLINTTLDLVQQSTGFGIEISGVKNLANLTSKDQEDARNYEVNILLKLALVLGFIGSVLTVVFSKQLSIWTFGDESYQWAFVLSAIVLVLRKLSTMQATIFQGLHQLKFLAKANLYSNLFALFLVLPLFYVYKMQAIVPSIVVTALVAFLVYSFYFKQLNIKWTNIPLVETFKKSQSTLKFGFLLSVSSFMALLANFLVQIYISSTATMAQVGLFNIGLVVVNQYIGMIFNVMATDYYPQLTRVVDNKIEASAYISKQAIFSMLVITPVIVLFVALAPFLIPLLFASDFLEVVPMVVVLVIAMLFKAASWSFGYMIIAKADSKIFLKTSVFFNALFVGLCCYGFKKFGLLGIGYAYILYYFLHLVMVQLVLFFRYQLRLEWQLYRFFLINFVFCISIFLTTQWQVAAYQIITQLVVVLFSILFSLYEINKKTNVLLKLKSYFDKKLK